VTGIAAKRGEMQLAGDIELSMAGLEGMTISRLIESDLGRCGRRVDVLVESTVGIVPLLFDSSPELKEVFWDVLVRSPQNINQTKTC
jgi:hypothetical protein